MTTLQITQDTISQASTQVAGMISYKPIVLALLGLAGLFLHNLIELNKINKANDGNVRIGKYLQYERFSILISIIMVITCVTVSQEIKQLEQAGKWLGFAFIAIGYMGQSLLIFVIGKAENKIGKSPDK